MAGVAAVEKSGTPIPEATLASIKERKLALKGPLTTPGGTGFRSVNVALRKAFELYANLRPAYTILPGRYDNVDIVLIRENLERIAQAESRNIGKPISDARDEVALGARVFEYYAGAITGPLQVIVSANYTNVATGFTVNFTGQIIGHASASVWDFGDGTVASYQPYATHRWATAGNYAVVLRAYNDSYPAGVSATVVMRVQAQPVHYVAVESAYPTSFWDAGEIVVDEYALAIPHAAPTGEYQIRVGVYRASDGARLTELAPR